MQNTSGGMLREGLTELRNLIQESARSWLVRIGVLPTIVLLFFYIWSRFVDVLATSGFEAHGYCLLWNHGLIVLYVASDSVIGGSYVLISGTLVFLVMQVYRTHRTIPLWWVFVAFGLFIIFCSATHFMDIVTLWIPAYWGAGTLKFLTAGASIFTASALPFQIPRVLALIDAASSSKQRRKELEEAHRILDQEATHQKKPLPVLAQELIDTARLQRDFVATVSHEYRTALFGVQGFSETLRDEECTAEEVKKYASHIHNQSERLERLISNLLDFEQMKSGEMSFAMEHIDLNTLIRNVCDQSRLAFKTHTFCIQLDAALPACLGSSDKLEQVLINLLNNAMKYSPQGGEILMGSRVKEGMAQAWVQDHGEGIPSEFLEKVFDPYFRLGVSRTIKGGSGLGLSISRQIIKMHEGHLWVNSAGDGKGSIFSFSLPLANDSVTDESLTEKRAAIRQREQ